jgi:PAS domain S-box-containing protein
MAGGVYCGQERGLPSRFFRAVIVVMALLSVVLSGNELLGQSAALPSLDPQKAITQYHHDVWNLDEGLPQSAIQALAQTPDGYIWIGLEEGLVRFDGVRFTLFFKGNVPAFTHNNIFALCAARDSSLWIGTRGGGLIRLKAGKFHAYTSAQGLSNDFVKALYEDRQGNLWIGTNGGLNCRRDGKFTLYTTREGLSHNAVLSIYEDSRNNLWIGTDGGGLNRLHEGKFTAYTTKEGLADEVVTAICEDKRGRLWIGTNSGLNCLADGKFAVYTSKDGLANDFVRAFYEDRIGSLWIGTYGGGLNRWREGKFETFSTKDGLSSDFVKAIYEDPEGSLWIGTYGGGLNRLREGKFTSYSTREGLSNNMVWSIYEDKKGSMWFGANRGLSCLKEGKISTYSEREGLPPYVITALCDDRAGNLWVGTEGGGLARVRGEALTVFTAKHGLLSNFVRSVYEDRAGNLWIGSDGGLQKFAAGNFTSYTTKDGLSNNEVTYIYEDHAGMLWISTRRGGLNRFHNGKFTAYTSAEGLSSDLLWPIYEDETGCFWIGTDGGGLNRFKDGKFTIYTTTEGLFDDVVFQILDDDRGNLWMSCNKGIFRVSKRELNDFAEGKISAINSVAYGKADGMKTSECNGGLSQPAGWKSQDGRLWFPTIKGAVVIDPKQILQNPLPPPVVIEEVMVNRNPLAFHADDKLSLSPESKDLEFHYTGLSFLAPQKVQFKYFLEGYDQNWVDAGARRVAYYTNIPPGDYTFRVIACNNDGVWNKTGAALAFYLKPVFYETTLFYFLCLLALVLTGASAYRFRERQIRARETREALRRANEALEMRVQERTADLIRTNEALRQSEEQFRRLNEKLEQRVLERTAELRAANLELEGEIAERKRAQDDLQYRVELEQLVAAISTHFINLPVKQIDGAINRALKTLGEFAGVDRSYVLQIYDDGRKMGNTHEWCAEGIAPQIRFMQRLELKKLPWAQEKIANRQILNILRVSTLPAEAGAEKAAFQARGIQSLLNLPMIAGQSYIGLIGFDSVRAERVWADDLINALKIIGEIFANALERQRAEKALQESEERFLQLAENINEVLWMESVDANRLIYVSPVYERVWGRSRQSLFEKPSSFLDTVHPEDVEQLKTHLGKQRRGQISETEYRIIRPDGTVRWIWDRGFPIRNGDGHVYRSAGISEDITERKQAEEQLRHYTQNLEKLVAERTTQIQELERHRAESEKLAATGRMAARIAHEINNPLAGIKNSFLLIKDAIPSSHQYYEYVGRIDKEIDRIARIIRQMFDLYRQEQDAVRRFRADNAIYDVMALLQPSLREHGLTCEIDAGNAATIVALPEGLLRQVLYNLIQNAIEASPAGGVVKIAAGVVDQTMRISIADQGAGIPEEVRPRIFEPFFTTKSKLTTGGLGLGLSVSKSLVESMRGTLAFETQVGAGTVFQITLPLNNADINP